MQPATYKATVETFKQTGTLTAFFFFFFKLICECEWGSGRGHQL